MTWDRADPNPPARGRGGVDASGGHDPKLTPGEIRALKLGAGFWLKRCKGGFRIAGKPRVSRKTADNLVRLKLAVYGRFGGWSASGYGEVWLQRHSMIRRP